MAAVTLGWILAPPRSGRALIGQATVLAAVAIAPDLDLLVDRHSQETHSLGAALIAGAVAGAWRWPVAATRLRTGVIVALCWWSHPLLDALGADRSPPLGVMLWWPISREHVLSGWDVFAPISRRWQAAGFLAHNVKAVARELALLGPVTVAVAWWRFRRGRGRATAGPPSAPR